MTLIISSLLILSFFLLDLISFKICYIIIHAHNSLNIVGWLEISQEGVIPVHDIQLFRFVDLIVEFRTNRPQGLQVIAHSGRM